MILGCTDGRDWGAIKYVWLSISCSAMWI
jgi:hypothetical protein